MRDRGQYYRDTFALEAIEVLMGPSSMLFGRGSTGGVINQVTKKPFLKNATELSLQATTNGLVRGTADVNVPFGQDSTNAARVSGKRTWIRAERPPMNRPRQPGRERLAEAFEAGRGERE